MTIMEDLMDNPQSKEIIADIKRHLAQGDRDLAADMIEQLLPPDQVQIFFGLKLADQVEILENIEAGEAANILEFINDEDAASLAENLEINALVEILDEMESDEAADLLGDLTPALRDQSLTRLVDSEEIQSLLQYPDETAGGLMTLDFYGYPEETPVGAVFQDIHDQPDRDEEIPYIYALDHDGRLTGITRLADLIRAHPEQPLQSIADPQFVSITPEADQEIAAQLLNQYDLLALPVVGQAGRLLGIITIDDAINALEVEATEDILQSAGILAKADQQAVKSEKMVRGSIWHSLSVRIPFLILTMIGGILAGSVIGVFEEALETVVVLAFFIPAIMNMGGNSGAQSTSIFIRGHALGQINLPNFWKLLLREIFIGLGMGLMVGLLAGAVAALWQGDLQIGLAVAFSIIATVTLATGLGFLVPLLLNQVGVDPAIASEPIITTIKDITGILIYFYFASLFISQIH
jgi:magnesium transporter